MKQKEEEYNYTTSIRRPNKSNLLWNTIGGNCKEKQVIKKQKDEEYNYTASTGGSRLSRTAVKPDSRLAQIFFPKFVFHFPV